MLIPHHKSLHGEITVPGDKSISHRSIMLGALAKGTTEVTGFLQGADCLSSISCFSQMGIEIENNRIENTVKIHGKGLHGLTAPSGILDVGNSGTTTRLMSGILAAQPFTSTVDGDASIRKRPMGRIMSPLSLMGAGFESLNTDKCAPFRITGGSLHGIDYLSPVASAQVKSAILLAGLYAEGHTSVTEPALSRNHTELMFNAFGADIRIDGTTVTVSPAAQLNAQKMDIPGDISSAAYFIAAGLLTPNTELTVKHVGINPTRDGILTVCKKMGAKITLSNERMDTGEPVADITVSTSALHGCTIEGDLIPKLIDEIPILAVMAAFADGTTVIRDAQELKVKESNRIDVMTANLSAMGADIEGTADGMVIHGGHPLHGAVIDARLDHRIAMSFTIAGSLADGDTEIPDAECVNISYPDFYRDLAQLSR
ncbi:MAG: 3-phosphoshikimate 1-carboxyvinyltransferase [Bacteroidales bacterium]|nr:3-phosphoshikimate 1-carboxyvinyltransferase [Clostridium sp.]MCM1204058.1 3-phosphoshikimate 1-carboxyvinyltransferase [Bacteroidales bacterium]